MALANMFELGLGSLVCKGFLGANMADESTIPVVAGLPISGNGGIPYSLEDESFPIKNKTSFYSL